MDTILIIDDEQTIRMLLSRILELEGYEVFQAKDRASGLEMLKKHEVQVILCDVFLPDGNGVIMVPELKKIAPQANIILLTAHGNIPDGVQAIKNGAFDYIVKGDDNRKIIPLVSRAMTEQKLHHSEQITPQPNTLISSAITGKSACLQEVVHMAQKVAATDACVLLTGETGTGKEVFAQSIHQASPRKDKPFIALNCSAFSKELLESELFGHKAGAFTGALKDKKGLFEEAHGGTIFLDEIGEMEFSLQAKLLRVLESSEFIKVGDTKCTKINVRIIAATNRDLKSEIEKGNFREDLYFRLSVFQIQLPPLRKRKEDIEILAQTFLQQFAKKLNKNISGITPEVLTALQQAEWKGNIRELRNIMERSAIVCDNIVTLQDLPVELRHNHFQNTNESNEFELSVIERKHIMKVLQYTHGNKTEAARLLKIGLATLYRKIETYHI